MFRLRKVKKDFGRQSLLFRGPILWNSLNNETRDADNVSLKKCGLDRLCFIKGTCVNLNKN